MCIIYFDVSITSKVFTTLYSILNHQTNKLLSIHIKLGYIGCFSRLLIGRLESLTFYEAHINFNWFSGGGVNWTTRAGVRVIEFVRGCFGGWPSRWRAYGRKWRANVYNVFRIFALSSDGCVIFICLFVLFYGFINFFFFVWFQVSSFCIFVELRCLMWTFEGKEYCKIGYWKIIIVGRL